jgi:hypothetical protein
MTMSRGRGASAVRTPSLIRDYLLGEVAFPDDQPGDAGARALEGDYIARIHQRIKLRIREIDPGYQYPRKHSFLSLVNALMRLGLVERTGRREEPEERGRARWEYPAASNDEPGFASLPVQPNALSGLTPSDTWP